MHGDFLFDSTAPKDVYWKLSEEPKLIEGRRGMETVAQEFQQDQNELNKAMVELQQLEIQFQESRIVKEEFDRLNDDSKIYKLIGPVLVPQDKSEADTNVSKRLEFITSQKTQVETKIQTLRERMIKLQTEVREKQIKAAVDAKTATQA